MSDPLAETSTVDDGPPPATARRAWLPAVMALATLVSTTANGIWMTEGYAQRAGLAQLFGADLSASVTPWYLDMTVWQGGLSFSLSLLLILFAHEMGHWLTARYYRVPVSFPLFIPFFPPLGTMGAVIGMQLTKMPARAQMRIAAFGPLAGMAVAIPIFMLGLSRSRILPLPGEGAELMFLGGSLLSRFLENWYFPEIPFGHDIFLHPAAFAGWAGFYVTALNLVPLGQLDGGHIAYGLFGETWNRVAPWVGYALVVMGVLVYPAWLVIALLVRFAMGWTHPDLMTDGRARGVDAAIGWVTVLVLVLTFMPSVILDADAPTIVQRLQLLFGTAE